MKKSEALRATRELLSDPAHWCQGWYWKNSAGVRVHDVDDPDIATYCLLGGLRKVTGLDESLLDQEGYFDIFKESCGILRFSLFTYNDEHSHEEVLALLDKAITYAEKLEHKEDQSCS